MTAGAPQWGEWGKEKKKVIHGLQVVICAQEIKENGMEPFGLNDIGLNVCRGNCQFAYLVQASKSFTGAEEYEYK